MPAPAVVQPPGGKSAAVLRGAIFLAVIVAAALATPGADGAERDGAVPASRARVIVSPGRWALVTDGRLNVVVRVRRGATLRATVGGRDVTSAFRRGRGGGTWAARVAAGRAGLGRLVVELRGPGKLRTVDSVGYVVGRRSAGFATLAAPARPTGGAAAVRLRLARFTRWLSVRLNGRNVTGALRPVGPGFQRAGALGPDDGLRFGRNSLTAVAYSRDGTYDVERRTIVVPPTGPLVGAADRTVRGRRTVRLQATVRLPAAWRGSASYRWRLDARPPGSRAVLRGATTRAPTFVSDRPGTYRASLRVASGRGSSGSGATGATAVASVDVVADGPPIGELIDTRASTTEGPVITLGLPGDAWYSACPAPSDAYAPLQLMVINRTTGVALQCVAQPSTSSGWSAIAAAAKALPASQTDLAVFSMPRTTEVMSPSTFGSFQSLMQAIGGPRYIYSDIQPFAGLSVIGAPGAPQDTATINASGQPSPAWKSASGQPAETEQPGAITGYLQQSAAGGGTFTYVSPDAVQYSTSASSTATSNQMTVGAQTFSASLPPGATGGFHVVQLDPFSLAPQGTTNQVAWPTNGTANDQAAQQALATELTAIATQPLPETLVLIQSIGAPKAGGSAWDTIAQQIGGLGGTRAIFNCVGLTAQPACAGAAGSAYALAGGAGIDAPAETNPTDGQPGPNNAPPPGDPSMSGVLRRSWDTRFSPNASDALGRIADSLLPVAYQDLVAWPSAPGGDDPICQQQVGSVAAYVQQVAAANAYITNTVLGLTAYGADVRDYYWNELDFTWDSSTLLGKLQKADYPGSGSGFAPCVFTDLVDELEIEFPMVDRVNKFFESLQGPFANQGAQLTSWMSQIATAVQKATSTQNKTASILNKVFTIVGDVTQIAGAVAQVFALSESQATGVRDDPPVPNTRAGRISAYAGVGGALLTLGADIAGMIDGGHTNNRIEIKANELEDELDHVLAQMGGTVQRVQAIILSDYGKLSTVYAKTNSDATWGASPDITDAAQAGLQVSTGRNFYSALMPLAFRLSTTRSCTASNCFTAVNGFNGSTPTTQAYKVDKAPTSLTNPLFLPVGFAGDGSPAAWGLNKPQYYVQSFKPK